MKKGEVALKVFPHIKLINNSEAAWLICNEEDRAEVIFEKISRKKGLRIILKQDKYVLLAVLDAENEVVKDQQTEMLEDMFGGYNPYGQDDRLIDPFTMIKNLKCK